jgi:hypothetical protein
LSPFPTARAPFLATLFSAASLSLLASAARSEEIPPTLCLAILSDVSGWVTGDEKMPYDPADPTGNEYRLQIRGFANAFRSPEVRKAIEDRGKIRVVYIEFATCQAIKIPTTDVVADTVDAYARRVERLKRSTWDTNTQFGNLVVDEAMRMSLGLLNSMSVTSDDSTGIGDAIMLAINWQERNCAIKGAKQVIDVAGDGQSNSGTPSSVARDMAAQRHMTINGLPITNKEENINRTYATDVITPNGRVYLAEDFCAFAQAMREKLVWEISYHPSLPVMTAERPAPRTARPARAVVSAAN